jgi:AcrR family transcriptional regulator
MTPTKDQLSQDIREKILHAARQRFRVYGYNKTTMAEIAKDCDMSAANLYRFFDNKLDIAVKLASLRLSEEELTLSQTIAEETKSAAERLKHFIFAMLHHTYRLFSEAPHISELVHAVCDARMDLVEQHMNNKTQILVTLLRTGNDSGEFAVQDPQQTAQAILTATTMFDLPTIMPLFSLEKLEQKAAGLTELLLNGLLKK